MRGPESAPVPPWEDVAEEPRVEITPEQIEERRQLVEEAREQSYLEAKKIYGTRFEAMGRVATTLLGKGWLWNRGEGGKDQTTEKTLQWIGKHIDIPLARAFEENNLLRPLKAGTKMGAGVIGVAALAGMSGPVAFLVGLPMGVDGVLDTIQFFKERRMVGAWQSREAKRKELGTATEQRKNCILDELHNSQHVVDNLATSKRRWGWGRLLGKLAATGGAAAWLHFHGISQGMQDIDKIHNQAANIIARHHGTAGLSGQEKYIVDLASFVDEKHQVVQHLDHAEFVYNKGRELQKILDMEQSGVLSVIHRGAETSHWLSNQSMVGIVEGIFAAAGSDALLTNESAERTQTKSLPPGPVAGEVVTGAPVGPLPRAEGELPSAPAEGGEESEEPAAGSPPPQPWEQEDDTKIRVLSNKEKTSHIIAEARPLPEIDTVEINGVIYDILPSELRPTRTMKDWEAGKIYGFASRRGEIVNVNVHRIIEHNGQQYIDCDISCQPLGLNKKRFIIPIEDTAAEENQSET